MHVPLRIEEVPARLRDLRASAGDPSFAEIGRRITGDRLAKSSHAVVSRATVYDCFRDGRKRFDIELVLAIVRALTGDEAPVRAWASALATLGRRSTAAALVDVTDTLAATSAPFVGRTRELAQLSVGAAAHWISAMPGAGKTTLAHQAARAAIAAGNVDRVIVADLRGHSPAGPPADPDAVVRAALRLLGEQSRALSASAARRLLRERLRAGKTLILLDDAASPDQVSNIVSQTSGLSVFVTSRVLPEEAVFHPMELSLFAPYESLALLDAVAGRAAIERDPDAANALLQLTEHHPLAVSITAARVADRDTWTLAEHLELARTRRTHLRLDEPIAHSLSLTYQLLTESAQRLLRTLAHHPVALLDRESIAAIAEGLVPDVDDALDALARHNLITRSAPGRIRMHELVRVYAMDLGLEVDAASQRDAASARLRQNVIARAWSAHGARSASRKSVGRTPRSPVGEFTFEDTAAETFFSESIDLLLHIAMDAADPAAVNLISETIDDALHLAGKGDDAAGLFRTAIRAARDRGDAVGELRALVDLGATLTRMGSFAEAETLLAHIDHSTPGWAGEAPLALNALGMSQLSQGRFDDARSSFQSSLAAAAQANDLWREGLLWNSIALLHLHEEKLDEARAALERSIEISGICGDLAGAARGRVNLAKLHLDVGDNAAAESEARRGLSEMESLGYIPGVAVAYSNLSAAVCALGRFTEGAALAEQGLVVATDAGMHQSEFELLRTIGVARFGAGNLGEARAMFERARDLAESLGDQLGVADCTEDLGDCAQAAGNDVRARRLRKSAAALRAKSDPR